MLGMWGGGKKRLFGKASTLGYNVGACGVLWGIEPSCHELLHMVGIPTGGSLDLLMEGATVHGRKVVGDLGRSFSCAAAGLIDSKKPACQRLIREEKASGK